jgi:hypothetical protein
MKQCKIEVFRENRHKMFPSERVQIQKNSESLYRSHPGEHEKPSELLVSTRSKRELSIGHVLRGKIIGINIIIFPPIIFVTRK